MSRPLRCNQHPFSRVAGRRCRKVATRFFFQYGELVRLCPNCWWGSRRLMEPENVFLTLDEVTVMLVMTT